MNSGRIFFVILLVMVGIGVGGYLFVRGDIFPVAVVNSKFISNKTFSRHMDAIIQFYEVSKKNAEANGEPPVEVPPVRELERATLHQLIEDALIEANFRAIVGKDGDEAIVRKLASVEERLATDEFGDSLDVLYGLSVDEFRDFVLVPQAKRELIVDALRTRNEEYDAWLADLERTANVRILLRGFAWNGGEVNAAE